MVHNLNSPILIDIQLTVIANLSSQYMMKNYLKRKNMCQGINGETNSRLEVHL